MAVQLAITTPAQAWGALKLPRLSPETRTELLRLLAQEGGDKYARMIIDRGLCDDHPQLREKFLAAVFTAHTPRQLEKALMLQPTGKAREAVLAQICMSPTLADVIVRSQANRLTEKEAEVLIAAAVSVHKMPRIRAERALNILSVYRVRLTPHMRKTLLLALAEGRATDQTLKLLDASCEYLPTQAPISLTERADLIGAVRGDGCQCVSLFEYHGTNRGSPSLTDAELRTLVPAVLTELTKHWKRAKVRAQGILDNGRVLPFFTDDELAVLVDVAHGRRQAQWSQ